MSFKNSILICFLTVVVSATNLTAQIPKQYISQRTNIKALEKFEDMRFGIMVHWGPSTLTNGEISWSMENREQYEKSFAQFNPTKFDANKWVEIAKLSGAKYFTLVAKHHDGYCLWNTQTTDCNVMNSPFKTDVVGAVAEACKKNNIAFGAYLSIMDIHEAKWNRCYEAGATMPGYPEGIPHIVDLTNKQTVEIIKKYNPFILWYDGQWLQGWDSAAAAQVYNTIKDTKDNIVVRLERSAGNDADYHCMEGRIGTYRPAPWEVVTSVSYPVYSFHDEMNIQPANSWIGKLSRIACGNGNLLLNFIPDSSGKISDEQVNLAKTMGTWLQTNGKAIFKTNGGPWYPQKWGGTTKNKKKVYVHIFNDAPETITLAKVPATLVSAKYISNGKAANVKQTSNGSIVINNSGNVGTFGNQYPLQIVELTFDKEIVGMINEKESTEGINKANEGVVVPVQEQH